MCKHAATSIVTATHREFGDFLTVQCDLCGVMLPDADVPVEVFEAWNDGALPLPRLDIPASNRAVDALWRAVLAGEAHELQVVVEAVNGG